MMLLYLSTRIIYTKLVWQFDLHIFHNKIKVSSIRQAKGESFDVFNIDFFPFRETQLSIRESLSVLAHSYYFPLNIYVVGKEHISREECHRPILALLTFEHVEHPFLE